MAVPILKQSQYLIATIQSALSDEDLLVLQSALVEKVGKFRSRGVDRGRDGAGRGSIHSPRAPCATIAHIIPVCGERKPLSSGFSPKLHFAMVAAGHHARKGLHGPRPRRRTSPTSIRSSSMREQHP